MSYDELKLEGTWIDESFLKRPVLKKILMFIIKTKKVNYIYY